MQKTIMKEATTLISQLTSASVIYTVFPVWIFFSHFFLLTFVISIWQLRLMFLYVSFSGFSRDLMNGRITAGIADLNIKLKSKLVGSSVEYHKRG